ncbi:hypothetical protein ACWGCI_32200 [Streptomyces sp. NPDC054949]
MSTVRIDSTTARAHHDAAGIHLGPDVVVLGRIRVRGLINRRNASRGIGTRYGKTPDSYLAGLHLRASMLWLKDLTRTT